MFNHDRLIVYQRARQFLVLADKIAGSLPRGRAYLVDQLRRAANSIVNNIAEGAAEFSALDKARFFRIALRSAAESAAVLDQCQSLALVSATEIAPALGLANEVIAMLTALVKRFAPPEADGGAGV
jgi:four helix bundle protein